MLGGIWRHCTPTLVLVVHVVHHSSSPFNIGAAATAQRVDQGIVAAAMPFRKPFSTSRHPLCRLTHPATVLLHRTTSHLPPRILAYLNTLNADGILTTEPVDTCRRTSRSQPPRQMQSSSVSWQRSMQTPSCSGILSCSSCRPSSKRCESPSCVRETSYGTASHAC
jgi:hypothetical protein